MTQKMIEPVKVAVVDIFLNLLSEEPRPEDGSSVTYARVHITTSAYPKRT